jgi:Flp pilus assembly protein TadG
VTVREAAVSAHDIPTRFWRDRRGVVGVVVAMLLPVLVGFAGIGVEVGLWFAIQRQNQSAADAAAISAALEYAAQIEKNGVTTNPAAATAAANTAANCNLFSTSTSSSNAVCPLPSSGSNTVTLYPCYGFTVGSSCNTSSSNGAQPNAVQVVLTQPLNTAFANFVTAIWGPNVNTVNVTTTAIAYFPAAGPACLLARDSISANAAFVNNGTLPNPNCWVAANSISGSALNCDSCTITGPTTVVGGDTVSNNGHLNGSPNRTHAGPVADPYATKLTHAFLTGSMSGKPACIPVTIGTQTSLNGNCVIAGDLALTGITNLSPGTYWVTDGSLMLAGTLNCPGCSPDGLGVTIIFTTTKGSAGTIGSLQVPSGQSLIINLNAPSTERFAGLLMVQDTVTGVTPTAGGPIGNPSATLSGLIYFPEANLSFAGNVQTDTSNCLVAVANGLSLTGNIAINDSGCQTAGLTTVPNILSVFLAV